MTGITGKSRFVLIAASVVLLFLLLFLLWFFSAGRGEVKVPARGVFVSIQDSELRI